MAEGFVRAKKLPDTSVVSAGTKLSGPEMTIGELQPLTDLVVLSMKEKGIDVTALHRKDMTQKMVDDADIVVSMAEPDTEPADLPTCGKYIRWKVEDPKGKDLETTRRIRDTIEGLVETILKLNCQSDDNKEPAAWGSVVLAPHQQV